MAASKCSSNSAGIIGFWGLLGGLALGVATASDLPKRYQDWLTGPTSYLLTRPEREAFLHLATDQEREAYVERFWELRNPEPNSGRNEFKEEFYRRIAYANAFLGREAGSDGWRTDRGRTYILLGRPQTSMSYLGHQELYPVELWFHANPGLPELPPFFYVLFYEKDGIGGYRFYHPYVDGPDKLLRSRPSKAQAYQYLRNISPELARATLTLIPGEPIDTDSFSGSMASATILNTIQGYNQSPGYVRLVEERARRLERVTSRIRYDLAPQALLAFVAYEKGEPWLHWQVEIQDPNQPKTARLEFQITARLYSDGQLVFERTDSPSVPIPERMQDELARRPFIYQDRMPVVPGRHRLAVTVRNQAAGRLYELAKELRVEGPGDRAGLSDILVVTRHEPDPRPRPFQFGGIKFVPAASPQLAAARGLRILYQVTAAQPRPPELAVEYVVGSVSARLRKSFEDKLDLRQADAFGSLTVAKSLSIEELTPGAYQLAVRVKDPGTGKISARSVGFLVSAQPDELPPIVVSRAGAGAEQALRQSSDDKQGRRNHP